MIEIRNLHKAFGDREVLKGITSTFDSGKTNLIIGQSGSGKTVLIKNIVGLLSLLRVTCFMTDVALCRCRRKSVLCYVAKWA